MREAIRGTISTTVSFTNCTHYSSKIKIGVGINHALTENLKAIQENNAVFYSRAIINVFLQFQVSKLMYISIYS